MIRAFLCWFILSYSLTIKADFQGSFNVENGLIVSSGTTDLVWFGAGAIDPRIFPGIFAPLGSTYTRSTTGEVFRKYGALDTDWTLDGLGSAVFSQSASFSKQGNTPSGTYLDQGTGIPSSTTGNINLLSSAQLRSMGCGTQLAAVYNIEVWTHDGSLVNALLVYTYINATSNTNNSTHGLTVSIPQNKQIALKVTAPVKDITCNYLIKGIGL